MYTRRETTDGVTVMNKDLYDNLQDGLDDLILIVEKNQSDLIALSMALQLYTKSKIPGLDDNIVILTFNDESGFTIIKGKYDSANTLLYA